MPFARDGGQGCCANSCRHGTRACPTPAIAMNFKILTEPGARLRIDKWLWAARFFKTRSLAADAVEKGRVRIGGVPVKPAKEVRVGDLVEIEIDRLAWEVRGGGGCVVRGRAAVAQPFYV